MVTNPSAIGTDSGWCSGSDSRKSDEGEEGGESHWVVRRGSTVMSHEMRELDVLKAFVVDYRGFIPPR